MRPTPSTTAPTPARVAAGARYAGTRTTDLRNNDFVVSFTHAAGPGWISAYITLNGKLFDRRLSKKEGKGQEARGEESGTRKKMDCPTECYARQSELLPGHDDAVGTVQIRGLRNFQYGKQS